MNSFIKYFVLLFALTIQLFSAELADSDDIIRCVALSFRKSTNPTLSAAYPDQRNAVEDVLLKICADMQTHTGEDLRFDVDHFGLVCVTCNYV